MAHIYDWGGNRKYGQKGLNGKVPLPYLPLLRLPNVTDAPAFPVATPGLPPCVLPGLLAPVATLLASARQAPYLRRVAVTVAGPADANE